MATFERSAEGIGKSIKANTFGPAAHIRSQRARL
jgi:hypothetical protein